jgi:adenosylcobinamide-GDP ribazoletransferase
VRGAVGFLTVIGPARAPRPADLGWFGAVGAALGAALGLVWWATSEIWPAPIAAALVLVADLALTGLLHVDGLADSADGLLPPLARERRLAVMAEPGVGAFAVATVAVVLLTRWAAVAALPVSGWRGVVLLAAVWATARAAMVLVLATQPYARAEGGLASSFTDAPAAAAVGATVTIVAALVVSLPRPGAPVGIAVSIVAGGLVALLARKRLGGYTGDVLGAIGVVTETVALVVAAADW